ncbi:ComEC/Rec2 family competence protein, partial [Corynebacterium bovis]
VVVTVALAVGGVVIRDRDRRRRLRGHLLTGRAHTARRWWSACAPTLWLSTVTATAWAVLAAWRTGDADRHPWLARARAGGRTGVRETVHVAGTPRQVTGGTTVLDVDVDGLGTVPVFIRPDHAAGAADLMPGQPVLVTGTAELSDRAGLVPLTLSTTRPVEPLGDPGGLWSVAAAVRAGLRTAAEGLPGGAGDLIPGMVVGDVSGQSPTDRQAALATGLSHLTAVSGANVAVVTGAAMTLAAVLGLRPAGRVVVAAVALAGFVVLIGPEPSVLRAAVMGVVGLIAVVSARRAHAVAAVSLAVIVLTAVDPGLAVSYGFVLSVVATVGIVSLGRLLGTRFTGWRVRRHGGQAPGWEGVIARAVGVAVAADVVTAPVVVHMTGVVSPTAILANLLVGPVVPVVTVSGTIAAVVSGAWPGAATVLLAPAVPAAEWVLVVARTLAGVPVVRGPASWTSAAVWAVVLGSVVWVLVRRPTTQPSRRRATGREAGRSGGWARAGRNGGWARAGRTSGWARPGHAWDRTDVCIVAVSVAVVLAVAGWRAGVVVVGPYAEVTGPAGPGASGTAAGATLDRRWAEDPGDLAGWSVAVCPGRAGGDRTRGVVVARPDQPPPPCARGLPDGASPPAGADAGPQVVVMPTEDDVLRADRARLGGGGAPPEMYVVTRCTRSRGMPTRTSSGVPVAYPCADGLLVLLPDGLHAVPGRR